MKDSKYYRRMLIKNNGNDKKWLTKMLLSIIVVLVSLIITNFDKDIRSEFKRIVLEENINFGKFKKIYNEFVGGKEKEDTLVVSLTNLIDYEKIDDSYRVKVTSDDAIEFMASGFIVYVGNKDDLGNTVIVQGNDGVDIWYSGVSLNDKGLYDYVSSGDILGNSEELYVTISIYEDGNLLKYEEYIK
jgi:stage IV sporulation protein FA